MHAQDMPLSRMCDELGLGAVLDRDGLRGVLDDMSAEEVDAIRTAFVAEASATPGPGANFPVDCRVDNAEGGVRVRSEAAEPNAVGPIARIENA
jgi:hypothetical protein